MNRSRLPLNEKQRLPTRRVSRSFTVRTPEPLSATATWISRGENRASRYVWPLRGLSSRARGAVRSTVGPAVHPAPAAFVAHTPTVSRTRSPFVAVSVVAPGVVTVTAARPKPSVTYCAFPTLTTAPTDGTNADVAVKSGAGPNVVFTSPTLTVNGTPAATTGGAWRFSGSPAKQPDAPGAPQPS